MHIVIVGGGLVGSLSSVFFSKRGEKVTVFESREDLRINNLDRGKSINLALSVRGLSALQAAGLDSNQIKKLLIPMKSRLIHDFKGNVKNIKYGEFGEAINSIDRSKLNSYLLDEAQKSPNVSLFFSHELIETDFDKKIAVFLNKVTGKKVQVNFDLLIGADGAYSSVRKDLMRKVRMNYEQKYIPHGYIELNIPPRDGLYAMDPSGLHIWPRHTFMMIALPNLDKSFTTTLFMPFDKFDTIKTKDQLIEFFTQEFPDSINLFGGKEELCKTYFKNPIGSLVSIKCAPYHYKDSVVIIGDASHAMVPFYGQGMNCGFEDCLVLDAILYSRSLSLGYSATMATSDSFLSNGKSADNGIDVVKPMKISQDLEVCLNEYSRIRHKDVVTICDLAMYNYVEMRSSVLSPTFLIMKSIEGFLHGLFPTYIIPLYTMVSFSLIPYHVVNKRWKRQRFILGFGISCLVGSIVGLGFYGLLRGVKLLNSNENGGKSNGVERVEKEISKWNDLLKESYGNGKEFLADSMKWSLDYVNGSVQRFKGLLG